MKRGAIVLCGGRSSRMGRDKATLPFGPECMLQRVVRLLSEVVDEHDVVVVASPGQVLPELPVFVTIVRDQRETRGPLEALATGLRALPPAVEVAYVTSCDVPLLVPAFVEQMFAELADDNVAVPFDGTHLHPLAAVYRREVLTSVDTLRAADQLRLRLLFDVVRTRVVNVERLRAVDPELKSLRNLNRPEDYRSALQSEGFSPFE